MININNKNWEQIEYKDIEAWLNNNSKADGQENFFFEFKQDDMENKKFIKEVSAFANTYGGYIFIGVDDDCNITGCVNWKEEKIHKIIYDSITPLPIFDVKTFNNDKSGQIIIVKIEPGPMPPYITNKGKIYERVSSGSIPINDSAKLAQLYKRNNDEIKVLHNAIELPAVEYDSVPRNVFGYIDLGFSIECAERKSIQSQWDNIGQSGAVDVLRKSHNEFSISRIGNAYCISVGGAKSTDDLGNSIPLAAGANNFIEISDSGDVRSRIILTTQPGEDNVNLAELFVVNKCYRDFYSELLGKGLATNFIYARKYAKITVLKQFTPAYKYDSKTEMGSIFNDYLEEHRRQYGGNLIVEGNRVPRNGYMLLDRRFFDENGEEYSDEALVEALFSSNYYNLGFVDLPEGMKDYTEESISELDSDL